MDMSLTLHEMFHGFVFSTSHYPYYIDSSGNVRGNSSVATYFFIFNENYSHRITVFKLISYLEIW